MAKYFDATGKEWEIHIGLRGVGLVKKEFGVDLLNLSSLQALFQDQIKVFEIIRAVQIAKGGETEEDFDRGHMGDALNDAVIAFTEAVISLYPTRIAEVMRKAFRESNAKINAIMDAIFPTMLIPPVLAGAAASAETWTDLPPIAG